MRIFLVLVSLPVLSCMPSELATEATEIESPLPLRIERMESLSGPAAVQRAISVMSDELSNPHILAENAKMVEQPVAARRAHLTASIATLESYLAGHGTDPAAAASSCTASDDADLVVASTSVYIGEGWVSMSSFSFASEATSIDHSMWLQVSTNARYWEWRGSDGTSCGRAFYSGLDGEFDVEYGYSWAYRAYGETTHFLPNVTDWSSDTMEYHHSGEN